MRGIRIIRFYFHLAGKARKRTNSLDATSQLIYIAKYLWLGISLFISAMFALFTRLSEESNDLISSFGIAPRDFIFQLIFYSVVVLVVYHFLPVMRKQVVIVHKHFPYSTVERFTINFFVNNTRISTLNILCIWLVFFLINSEIFPFEILLHSLLQLLIVSILIFNLKELLTWRVPRMLFFFIANLLHILFLAYLDLVVKDFPLYYEFIILASSLLFSILTELVKIERMEIGSLRTTKDQKIATFLLPFRTPSSLKLLKFILTFDLLTLLIYDYLSLEIFKTILYFTMMVPLSLMTNYGNNIFGYAFNLSMNLFYRQVGVSQIGLIYFRLILFPYLISFLISGVFFYFFSSNFLQDLVSYICVSFILMYVGYIMSLQYPIKIDNNESWLGRNKQVKQSTLVSIGVAALWLILVKLSFSIAMSVGFLLIIMLLLISKFSKINDRLISTFGIKAMLALRT